jgi:hypothetical protein
MSTFSGSTFILATPISLIWRHCFLPTYISNDISLWTLPIHLKSESQYSYNRIVTSSKLKKWLTIVASSMIE